MIKTLQKFLVTNYVIEIDGRRFKNIMIEENSGELDELRKEKEIEEYKERILKYNGSNYYEGMEYKIIERQKEK